jgi:outer membrane protein TolC
MRDAHLATLGRRRLLKAVALRRHHNKGRSWMPRQDLKRTLCVPWIVALALTGLATWLPSASWAMELSLADARGALLGSSDKLRASEQELSRRESDARAAQTLGYPDLRLDVSQVFGRKEIELGPLEDTINLDGPRSALVTTWPLYTGGRIEAAQRALAAEVVAAGAQRRGVAERIEFELAQRYFQLRLARYVLALRRAQLEQAERQLQQARGFETQGQVARVERLSVQVARDEVARDVVRAQSDATIAEAALRRMLRLDTVIEPTTPLFVMVQPLPPLTDWLSQVEGANPALATLDAKSEAAAQGVEIARAEFRPTVSAFADYELIKHYLSFTEPNWKAGIGISYKIFSREDRSSKIESAKAQQRQVQATRAEALNEVLLAAEAQWRRVEQAREQFVLLDSSLELARENLRLRERAFAEGQSTSIDVNDARNAVIRAETGRAQVAYEYVIALVALLEVSGQTSRLGEFQRQAHTTF